MLVLSFHSLAAVKPVSLQLSASTYLPAKLTELTPESQHWLRQKKVIKVAVYESETSPIMLDTASGRYRGMNADYLSLLKHSLSVKVEVLLYPTQHDALQALKNGEVDTLLTTLGSGIDLKPGMTFSRPVIQAWPALVTSLSNIMAPYYSNETVTIARANDYPDKSFILHLFPNGQIFDFDTVQEALFSVSNGQSEYFMGDSLTSSLPLSQEFYQALATIKYWAEPPRETFFIFNNYQQQLPQMINAFILTLDKNIHSQIAQSMIEKGNLSFLTEQPYLSARDSQWLEKNRTLRVLVNPWFTPFAMLDSNGDVRGIVGDILNLISLQTGIAFETRMVRSNEEMRSVMKSETWHIVQIAYDYPDDDNTLAFTHPFVTTNFVTVTKTNGRYQPKLQSGMTVSITAQLLPHFQNKYPDIHWRGVENSSIAIIQVATGVVDAAVANQLTTRYMEEHFYPDQIQYLTIMDEPAASIRFATPRSEPELRTILDNALDNIPQKEILQITGRWIRAPEIKIDTWELYNRPFYIVTVLGLLIIISSGIWGSYLFREVSRRKKSQKLLEEEHNKVQQANQGKREFLSRMSHEIRTPVSAIIGFLELLEHDTASLSLDQRQAIDQAAIASRRLLNLIGEILDLEKVESRLTTLHPQWVNIDTLTNGVIKLFSALAMKKSLVLRYESRLDPATTFWLDAQFLEQILTNLIGNAVKFTRQGNIRIFCREEADTLVLSVTDTGPGMSQEELARLFNVFSQGEAGVQHTGSGLGLDISKALAICMGGSIEVKSTQGLGSAFMVRLPAKRSLTEKPAQLASTSSARHHDLPPGLRVIIAEDQPASRLLLKRQLDLLHIQADEAANGEEAFRKINQNLYDLLITDVNMPVMNGIQLTQKLREEKKSLFICGLTATAQAEEQDRCLAAGMNSCLFKPINLTQLANLLSKVEMLPRPAFDMDKLSFLAQGNITLMIRALQDAQQENRHAYAQAYAAAADLEWQSVLQHIHRINGTAQLLGADKLHAFAQTLEQRFADDITTEDARSLLENLEEQLTLLDDAIAQFAQEQAQCE